MAARYTAGEVGITKQTMDMGNWESRTKIMVGRV